MIPLLVLLLPDLLIAQAVLNELLIPELLLRTRSRKKAVASLPARFCEMRRGVMGSRVQEGQWLGRTVPALESRLESSFIMWLNFLIGQAYLHVVFLVLRSHYDRRGSHFLRSVKSNP